MARPSDPELYEAIKKQLFKEMPVNSAYRSGQLVQRYKKAGGTYLGQKPSVKEGGLTRWFKEEWKTDSGGTVYKRPGDVFRPTKRITRETPITFQELTKAQIREAKKEKLNRGRVSSFK